MRINIYQIDGEKDTNRVKFSGYDETMKHGGIISQNYKCVFHGDVDGDLEDVYTLFNNCDHPGTYQGHSLSVSDIVEAIGDSDGVEPGSYFVDSIGFEKLPDFDSTQCAEMDGLRMLMIQPHRTPIVTYVQREVTKRNSRENSSVSTQTSPNSTRSSKWRKPRFAPRWILKADSTDSSNR